MKKLPLKGQDIIIRDMKIHQLHSWQLDIKHAKEKQRELANQITLINEVTTPHLIAGVDISVSPSNGLGRAAVVILSYPELEIIEIKTAEGKLEFPYVPGFLSFREAPLILDTCQKLLTNPDLFLVDGHGIAHPRRLGLASHLGLFLKTPTIGCAKSRLCGWHEPVPTEAGSFTTLTDNNEIIGAVVRTKTNVKPIFISVGTKIDLSTAIFWSIQCCRGYRLPEPCRLAHLAANNKLSIQNIANIK